MDFRVFVEPQQGATYADQLAVAKTAEAAGYSAFFRSDHYLAMAGDGMPGPTDSWVTLGGIARETSTIRLGTMVTSATFRHPGVLAISVAQVDEMSGGRVDLGLGAGWFEAEHEAYAIPFPPLGERFDRLGEQLDILTGLWSTPVGETYDYTGTHYSIKESPALPKPVAVAVPADHHRRRRAQAHPGADGEVRLRVQHPVRRPRHPQDAVRPGRSGGRGRRPRAGLADVLGGVRGVRRARRRRGRRPRRGDRPRGRRSAQQFAAGGHARRRSPTSWIRSPRPACSGCTSRSSTSPISTTSSSSPAEVIPQLG